MPDDVFKSRNLQDIKRIGPKRAALLKHIGFNTTRDIRRDPLLFFTSIKPYHKQFVVRHHDREKIILEVFHLAELSGLKAYKTAVKGLPRNTWVAEDSIFSILSPCITKNLVAMGLSRKLALTAQGELLTHGIYRLAHIHRPDKQARIKQILSAI